METWQELKVTVKREGEELVSNLLIELGAQGVAIEDSMDYVGNVDRFGEIFLRSSNKKKSWRFAIINVDDKPARFKARVVDR